MHYRLAGIGSCSVVIDHTTICWSSKSTCATLVLFRNLTSAPSVEELLGSFMNMRGAPCKRRWWLCWQSSTPHFLLLLQSRPRWPLARHRRQQPCCFTKSLRSVNGISANFLQSWSLWFELHFTHSSFRIFGCTELSVFCFARLPMDRIVGGIDCVGLLLVSRPLFLSCFPLFPSVGLLVIFACLTTISALTIAWNHGTKSCSVSNCRWIFTTFFPTCFVSQRVAGPKWFRASNQNLARSHIRRSLMTTRRRAEKWKNSE